MLLGILRQLQVSATLTTVDLVAGAANFTKVIAIMVRMEKVAHMLQPGEDLL
jgi:hypothetical protein